MVDLGPTIYELVDPDKQNPQDLILAGIEQFEKALAGLYSYLLELPEEYLAEGLKHHARLLSVFKMYDTGELAEFEKDDTRGPNYAGKLVVQAGLAGELLKDRAQLTLSQLSEKYGISATTVSAYFKYYDRLSVSQQAKHRKMSIFDTTSQLENLATVITRQLARQESENPEAHVKYVSEMSKLIKMASDLTDKIYTYRKMEELSNVIAQVLSDELPDKRVQILGLLKSKTNFSL